MIQLEAAGATDVGKVRRNNQDAFLTGESVFAVADGMGGHLAGEVASAEALEPVAALDGRVFPDPQSAMKAVVEAVVEANRNVSEKASGEANYQGMGTTLTAAVFEGRRIHIAHVGDSRAYLLRHGRLSQLTTDHTLVQHLIDEGQITAEEAATHPQRSIITRAIGVAQEVLVDEISLDLEEGDVVLLCSDGLSGFVPRDAIERVVSGDGPLEEKVDRLIGMANDAGGADNITAVLLRYGGPSPQPTVRGDEERSASDTAPYPPARPGADVAPATETDAGVDAGSADGAPPSRAEEPVAGAVRVRTSEQEDQSDWAQRLGRFGNLGVGGGRGDEPPGVGGGGGRALAVVLGVVLLLVLAVAGGRWLLSRSYYVGIDRGAVAIYQGIPVEIGPLELSWVVERTSLSTDEVPDYFVTSLEDGIAAIDRRDARLIVDNAPRRDATANGGTEAAEDPTTEPSPDAP